MNIEVSSLITVDGEFMTLKEFSPERFKQVLELGDAAIRAVIDGRYQRMLAKKEKQLHKEGENTFVPRPFVYAIKFTRWQRQALSDERWEEIETQPQTGPLVRDSSDLKRKFRPYWDGVLDTGFVPVIRDEAPTGSGPRLTGIILAVTDAPEQKVYENDTPPKLHPVSDDPMGWYKV